MYTVMTEDRLLVTVKGQEYHDLAMDDAKRIALPFAEQREEQAGHGWSLYDCIRIDQHIVTVVYEGDYSGPMEAA